MHEAVSARIQSLIEGGTVPDDVAAAIRQHYEALGASDRTRFAEQRTIARHGSTPHFLDLAHRRRLPELLSACAGDKNCSSQEAKRHRTVVIGADHVPDRSATCGDTNSLSILFAISSRTRRKTASFSSCEPAAVAGSSKLQCRNL